MLEFAVKLLRDALSTKLIRHPPDAGPARGLSKGPGAWRRVCAPARASTDERYVSRETDADCGEHRHWCVYAPHETNLRSDHPRADPPARRRPSSFGLRGSRLCTSSSGAPRNSRRDPWSGLGDGSAPEACPAILRSREDPMKRRRGATGRGNPFPVKREHLCNQVLPHQRGVRGSGDVPCPLHGVIQFHMKPYTCSPSAPAVLTSDANLPQVSRETPSGPRSCSPTAGLHNSSEENVSRQTPHSGRWPGGHHSRPKHALRERLVYRGWNAAERVSQQSELRPHVELRQRGVCAAFLSRPFSYSPRSGAHAQCE